MANKKKEMIEQKESEVEIEEAVLETQTKKRVNGAGEVMTVRVQVGVNGAGEPVFTDN
jgi:hypothetical protein